MGDSSFSATDDGVIDQKEDEDQNGKQEKVVVEQTRRVWGRGATRCGVVGIEGGCSG